MVKTIFKQICLISFIPLFLLAIVGLTGCGLKVRLPNFEVKLKSRPIGDPFAKLEGKIAERFPEYDPALERTLRRGGLCNFDKAREYEQEAILSASKIGLPLNPGSFIACGAGKSDSHSIPDQLLDSPKACSYYQAKKIRGIIFFGASEETTIVALNKSCFGPDQNLFIYFRNNDSSNIKVNFSLASSENALGQDSVTFGALNSGEGTFEVNAENLPTHFGITLEGTGLVFNANGYSFSTLTPESPPLQE